MKPCDRCAQLEEVIVGFRNDVRDAIRVQEQLHEQLRAAIGELNQTSLGPQDRELQRLESRVRGVEQRLNRTTEQLQGILQSRIWRTLVRGGGLLLRLKGGG